MSAPPDGGRFRTTALAAAGVGLFGAAIAYAAVWDYLRVIPFVGPWLTLLLAALIGFAVFAVVRARVDQALRK